MMHLNTSLLLQSIAKNTEPLFGAVPTGVETAPRHNEISSNLDEQNVLSSRGRSTRFKRKLLASAAMTLLSQRTPDHSPIRNCRKSPPPQRTMSEWMADSPPNLLQLRTSTPEPRDYSTPSSPHGDECVASGSCPMLGGGCVKEIITSAF
jgi:hypothetical protein